MVLGESSEREREREGRRGGRTGATGREPKRPAKPDQQGELRLKTKAQYYTIRLTAVLSYLSSVGFCHMVVFTVLCIFIHRENIFSLTGSEIEVTEEEHNRFWF